MVSKSVNTTIPDEYHKRAILNDVSWTRALCIGIDVMTDNFNEVASLGNKITESRRLLRVMEERYEELQKEAEKQRDAKLTDKETMAQALRMNNPARYVP